MDAVMSDGEDEDEAERQCEIAWDNKGARATVIKSTAAPVKDFTFTLSDETVDRYGDIVSADGWELDWFRKNPIALFGHDHDFPIGKWADVHVEKKSKALRGTLDIPKGVSPRIDEIGRLVDGGYLNAVSVGFRPTKKPEPLKEDDDWGPVRYVGQELLECSVVPVPANPNALIQARALGISSETIKLVFAESGNSRPLVQRRTLVGESAIPPRSNTRRTPMPSTTFAQRIEDLQNAIVLEQDGLADDIRDSDDDNPDDSVSERITARTARVGLMQRRLEALKSAEAAAGPAGESQRPQSRQAGRDLVPVYVPSRVKHDSLQASASEIALRRADGSIKWRAPPSMTGGPGILIRPRKELDPVDYLVRNGVVMLLAHRSRKSHEEILAKVYKDDPNTVAAFNAIQKAATAPAMTDVQGWAAELVEQIYADFMYPLMPQSIFPRLAAQGMSLDFGRAGIINMPTRVRTTTIAGSFVGEGQPIPVRQALFATQAITPKKLGVITVMTREIEQHSIPAIEGLLRQAISEDTGESIDSVLLDQNPADQVRPPGIRNGITVTPFTPQAAETSGFYRMVRDIRSLKAALIGPTNDNVRAPCWMMNPIRADAIALNPAPGTGLFPFRDDIRAGRLEGWPVFESTTIDRNQIIVVDAADFVTAGQGAPTFEVSDQATLHMEDTAPGPIHGPQPPIPPGTPGPATPVRSLWQTDSYALRLLYRVNWMLRRPMVAWMTGFTWGYLSDVATPGADEQSVA
jgi:HK97 family phage prohead protease